MPEVVGTVTARSAYGIKIDNSEDWYNWSKEDFRGEPWDADLAVKGTRVVCAVDGKYIQSVKVVGDGQEPQFPPVESAETPVAREWGYRHKDILMFIESCAKGACGIYAAALAGGQVKEMPTGGEITALARSIEEHGVARFKALLEALD